MPADLEQHKTTKSCWVTLNRKVFDVTSFISDHPGGEDLITRYAGQDMQAIMADPAEHVHSQAAYEILSDLQIGLIGNEESTCREDTVIDEHFVPDITEEEKDFEKNRFLDLKQPLVMQVWRANFSKNFYLQQVHQPRYLAEPARLFGPRWMDLLTRTNWYVVPIVWLPITLYLFRQSLLQQATFNPVTQQVDWYTQSAVFNTMMCFFFGNFFWTILEYGMHRFLFHVDDHLPDAGWALTLHFLLHGVHHYLPCDRLRLVMPPTLFAALSYPFCILAHKLFPAWMANGIIAGSFAFYILYDMLHYSMHHSQLPQYLREMKIYHMAHHFKNYELGYGVTSKFWDVIFNTQLRV